MQGLDELRRIIADGGAVRTLVIAPRWTAIRTLQRELIGDGGILFGLRATTFQALMQSLAAERLQLPRRVSQTVALEIIGEAVRRVPRRTPILELLARRSGRRVTFNTFRELSQLGLGVADLRAAGGETLEAVADVLEQYEELCRVHDICDDAAWWRLALRQLAAESNLLPEIENLWVSGFSAISPPYAQFLKILARDRELFLHLPTDGGASGLFEANDTILAEARDWGAHACHPLPVHPCAGAGALGLVQRGLFSTDLSTATVAPAEISFHRAPRRYDEVEAAAIAIARLLEGGVAPAAIGLCMRNLADYDRFIVDVFDRLGIPFAFRRGQPILLSPPVRRAMRFCEIGHEPVRWDEVIGLFRSAFGTTPDSTLWQEIVIASGVFKELPQHWRSRLARVTPKGTDRFSAEDVAAAAAGIGKLLDDCQSLRSSNKPLTDLKRMVGERISTEVGGSDERVNTVRFTRQLRTFMEQVDALQEDLNFLAGLPIVPDSDPLELLREAVEELAIPEEQHTGEAVHVLNFFDMGYHRVQHLFIVGLDEQTVPRPPHQGSGILGDRDIERLRAVNPAAAGLRTAVSRRQVEEQAFLLAVGGAGTSLHCFTRSLDDDGKEVTASPYFIELQRLAGAADVIAEPGGDRRRFAQTPDEIHARRRQLVRLFYRADLAGDPDRGRAADALAAHLADPDERKFFARIDALHQLDRNRERITFGGGKPDRWTGRIEDEALRAIIREKFGSGEWSWSQRALETYAACPFAFFLEYLLGILPHELPQEEDDPRAIGIAYHHILQQFVTRAAYPLGDADAARALMRDIVLEEFHDRFRGENPDSPAPGPKLWLRRTLALMDRFVAHELKDAGWLPLDTEQRFAAVIEVLGETMRLTGRFDRIDHTPESEPPRYRVLDYKSGKGQKLAPKPANVAEGFDIQLPLYILGAAGHLDADWRLIVAALHGLEDDARVPLDPTEQKWAPLFTTGSNGEPAPFPALLAELVAGIRAGQYPVEGRGGAEVPKPINLVGRWLELPPELAEEAD
jgi:RecB family exonuclease